MSELKSGQWTFNSREDGVWYHDTYETKEEAIKDGKAYYDEEETFFIGQVETLEIPEVADGWDLIERAIEQIHDECGEASENYLSNVSKEQVIELESMIIKAFKDWSVKNNLEPQCYKIINIEAVEV